MSAGVADDGKVMSLASAVSRFVGDGDLVFVGGFGQGVPFALGHEIVRQGKQDLTLCRTGADILFDLLVAAGCVRRVIFGWYGNPGIGLSHVLRRAVEANDLEVEETSNFGLLCRLHAAALGLPFLPTRSLRSGDVPAWTQVAPIICPFTGEELAAVPALRPDVAIIHAHRADREGNICLRGVSGDTIEGAKAARRVVCTVERICDVEETRADPLLTVIDGSRVVSVTEVPLGAHPSYMTGHYGRDDNFYRRFDTLSRDSAELEKFIDTFIKGTTSHDAYLELVGAATLDRLRSAA